MLLGSRRIKAVCSPGGRRSAAARRGCAPPAAATPQARIFPPADHKPSNPRWLTAVASADPDDLPDPPRPPALDADAAGGAVEPGSAAAAELFVLDPSWTYLNHGSYGAALRAGLEAQEWHRQQLEAQPVLYIETSALAGVAKAVAQVARLVGASWRDVVPVVNATTGVNAAVASLPLRRGDLVLMTNATYPAVRSTLARAAARAGADLLEVLVPLGPELHDASAVEAAFASALALARASGRRVALAVVDHVLSFPPVVMPLERLCALLRAEGVPVAVDGAHALGSLAPRLDVPSLGCDFYVANAHKWLCTPKGVAFLWAAPARQTALLPPVTSHGCGLGFRGEFLWQGTGDPTAWLAVPACLEALERLGGAERLAARNHALVWDAAELLRTSWGVEEPPLGAPPGGGACAGMAAVRLPSPLLLPGGAGAGDSAGDGDGAARREVPATPEGAAALQAHLRARHRIEVPLVAVQGALWCRVSAQAYNTLEQFASLAGAVAALRPGQGGAGGAGGEAAGGG
ncbi:class V aminotransferase [Raphidocelis subcapitata]|uniref:Class V aminotransferase n=1 Tax=Raphidocelis subcapitata TaxID=307507 RepID=A0A2V0NQ30_9CHLO|nr:class V aminotransferase [Raphidocelis subcapitata]|eukprot:GBF87620.1 class V aminotransferase [Raphidocelis subcapitata]